MKLNKGTIINLIFLAFLAIIFFTPAGKWIKVKINELTLTGPSIEKPNRDFNLSEINLSLKGYNGFKDTNLSNFKGKVVFLNFWGSWCPPCIAEMPSIEKLYQEQGEQVKFVLVTMNDKPNKFIPFLKKNNYTMPVYEAQSLIPSAMQPKTFPTTYIIDKKGEVVLKETAAADWNSVEVKELLNKLASQ